MSTSTPAGPKFQTELERELYEALDLALPFVAVWGGAYQSMYRLQDIHPTHKEALDKVQAALAKARSQP